MRARRLLPMLLVLATVAVGATGCFSSKVASTTINGEVTIGQGSTAQTVNPSTGGGSATTTETTSTGETSTAETSTAATSTGETTTGGGSGADVAAGKTAFVATCGGCHALKDAGTNGNVGPDLDSLAPLSADRVAKQIENGGGAMPAKLLTGADAANVAAYVASVAGK
jgi:cytochrome c6